MGRSQAVISLSWGGAGQRAQAGAALSWNAALPPTADSYLDCLGRSGLTQRLILKAASFRVFLWCGSKESLSWRNCCHQKEALFGQEVRPAWGGVQATGLYTSWVLSVNLRAHMRVVLDHARVLRKSMAST